MNKRKGIEMSYVMTKAEREAFLADLHVGILSVALNGRGPVSVPIWYIYQPGGELFFCSVKSTRKVEMIRSAGRITICVVIEKPPSKYVSVEGAVVSVEPCDFERDQLPIARKYLGAEKGDQYTKEIKAAEEVVKIRMQPERWSSADYSKQP
jgi:nitroimidazol reductase NimA-like FMN-containing flavoprotein (pyridoxamine 5'-phosphate oxidase superfamily)